MTSKFSDTEAGISQAAIDFGWVTEEQARANGVKIGKYGLVLYWSKHLQKWVTIPEAQETK